MNMMWITAEPTTSPSAANAIRQRLMNPPIAKRVLQITEVEQTIAAPEPEAVIVLVDQDAHVKTWQAYRADFASPGKALIRRRCTDFGMTYEEIIGKSRLHAVVNVRQILMYEVWSQLGKSFPEIGRLFGGKDHTTAIHSVRVVEAFYAAGGTDMEYAKMSYGGKGAFI